MKVGDLVKSKFSFFEGQLGLIVSDDVWGEAHHSTQPNKWCFVKLLCNGDTRMICSKDMEVVRECQENVKSDVNSVHYLFCRVTL